MISQSELTITEHYFEDRMKMAMHMSKGSEAINSGVCLAMKERDQVFGTYRAHALYLAKTGDIDGFFAEMYGKKTSPAKGKAGSMHLSNPSKGYLGSSAIVGTTISVAVGSAYANKQKRNGKMTAVFFGDGAPDEGTFWESLNFACLKKIPILFVLEDNGLAVHSPIAHRQGFEDIDAVVSKFNCNVLSSDTTDVEVVHNMASKGIDLVKSTEKPTFMHFKYYRCLAHVGVGTDFDKGYRDQSEYTEWMKREPVMLQREKLLLSYSEEEIRKIEIDIDNQIKASLRAAEMASLANVSETYRDVFYEDD